MTKRLAVYFLYSLLFVPCFCVTCMDSFVATRSRSDSIVVSGGVREFLTSRISSFSEKMPSTLTNSDTLDDGNLYVFALDVGQANFIIMRKSKEIVVVDAGLGSKAPDFNFLAPKIKEIFDGATLSAVFITHPHDDHFNIFLKSSPLFLGSFCNFSNTEFYLGGTDIDWQRTARTKEFISQITSGKCHYSGEGSGSITLMGDVSFRLFYLPRAISGVNKLSLLIQASYKDKNVLFTGDSEGDSIDRVLGSVRNLQQIANMFKLQIPPDSQKIQFIRSVDKLYLILNQKTQKKFTVGTIWNDIDITGPLELDKSKDSILSEYWRLYNQATVEKMVPFEHEVVIGYLAKNLPKNQEFANFFCKIIKEWIISSIAKEERIKVIVKLLEQDCLKKDPELASFFAEYEKFPKKIPINNLQEILNKYMDKILRSIYRGMLESNYFMQRERLQFLQGCYEILERAKNPPVTNPPTPSGLGFYKTLKIDLLSIQKALLCEYLNFMLQRRIFDNSQIVFIPHHGTHTEYSQRFLGFFSGMEFPKVYIVSSSPFDIHGLPKRSTLEMAPLKPIHPEHPFIYYEDFTDIGDNAALQMTTKPIYVTGAAPGGYYFLSVVNNITASSFSSTSSPLPANTASIFMFDSYNRGSGVSGGWFNVLT